MYIGFDLRKTEPVQVKIPKAASRNKRPTIVDVAREARVGVMTVSRVINNYKTVRPVTFAKVMKAITKVGYEPNDAARILKGMRARTIGLIIPDLSDFFSNCFHAVQSVAIRHDYQTLVVATGRSAFVEDQQLRSIASHRVAGLILVTSGGSLRQLQALQESGIPIVALDRPVVGLHADAVLVENREGAEAGVSHLISHGHKKIACIGFRSGAFTVSERIKGYLNAMRSAGLKPRVFDGIGTIEAMELMVAGWAKGSDRPTAVFTTKRITSILLVQALHRYKFRVPEDLAVIGFDDFELAEALGTPLTVISQSPGDLARSAAEILFKQIASENAGGIAEYRPSKVIFPATLIIRASCGCPARR